MANKVKVSSYLKNVAKSFGYAIGDVFAEANSVVKSVGSEAKSTAESIFENIKSVSYKSGNSDEKSLKQQAKQTIDDVWNNFTDDLKTGNWYNKQRSDEMDKSAMKAMGFDMDDWDFDFDFDDDDLSSGDEAIVASNDKATADTINAMDIVGGKVADSISGTTVEAASYIVRSNSKSARALYALNERGFTSVNKSIGALNQSISSFAQIVEPLSKHMQNSAVFYTNTTKSLQDIYQSVQQIAKNTTPVATASNGRRTSVSGKWTDIFDSDGMISIDSYKDMVKTNFGQYKDIVNLAMNAIKGFKSEDGSYGKNISLMQMATTMITKVLIPKVFIESMKNFNEDLKNFMSGTINKVRHSNGGLLFELFKDFILPRDGFKTEMNTGNYEKGQVAWDGISRKALTEVIPTTLLKIYSAITGGPEQVYDYQRGKLVNVSSIRSAKKADQMRYAQSAGGEFRDAAIDKVMKNDNYSDKDKERMKAELDEYFYNAFMKGKGYNEANKKRNADVETRRKYEENFKQEFGLSDETLAIIQELSSMTDAKSRKNRGRFTNGVNSQRAAYGDYIRNQEAAGTSLELFLNNGFYPKDAKNTLKGGFGTDEYGKSSLNYLRGIYLFSGFIADNLAYLKGKKSNLDFSGMKRRAGKGKAHNDGPSSSGSSRSNGGERTRADANTSSGSSSSESSNNGAGIDLDNLDEDQQERKDRDERVKEAKKKGKSRFDSIWSRFKSLFNLKDENSIFAMYTKPFKAAASFLDNIGISLDSFFWNDDQGDNEGLFNYFKRKTNEMFSDIGKKLDDMFHIKDKWEKAKDKLLGKKLYDNEGNVIGRDGTGVLGNASTQFKATMGNVGSSIGNTVKKMFKSGNEDNGTAAYGRKVTKSGIVSVSEGELIIPSELNPFYHGSTSKVQQKSKEIRNANKFYGFFADGDPSVGNSGEGNSGEESGKKQNKWDGPVGKVISEGFSNISSGVQSLVKKLFGDKDSQEKEDGIIKNVASKLMKEAGNNLGNMGAGALIGAGVSVATGAVVGPLLGAGIGAATGLIVNSKTVQHILFGADPETGEINGGLLNKQISEFMMKKVPGLAKGAGIGAAAGLFMGSPILGAIAGTTVSYISQSEKAKEWLFGKKDEKGERDNSGLISGDFQRKLKKAYPNVAIGALAGLAAGPFGIVGNLAVGAGMGYLSTSKDFQNWMFGNKDDKDDKGFVGLVKDKIFGNLDIIFHNMGNQIAGWGKNLLEGTKQGIKDFFTKKARAYENGEAKSPIDKIIGGIGSKVGSGIKGATNKVGNLLGGIASRTQAHNLSKGYKVYGVGADGKKKNLTAKERMDLRGGSTVDTFGKFDSLLAKAKSPEELQELKQMLQNAKDPDKVFKREMNSVMGSLYSALSEQDVKVATKAGKLLTKVSKGDNNAYVELKKMISGMGLPEDKLEAAMAAIEAAKSARAKANSSKQILNNFAKAGMNFKKGGNINNALDRIDDELKNRKDLSPEEQDRLDRKSWRERIKAILEKIEGKVVGENSSSKKGDNKSNDNNSNEEGEGIRSEIDMFGNVHQYTTNNQGEVVEDNKDKDTRASRKIIDKFMNSVNSIPLIGPALHGLSSLFGKKDEEKKKGLLDRLFGEDGPFKGIGEFFKGKTFKDGLSFMFKSVIAPALLIGGFAGKFDGIGESLSNSISALKGNDTQATLANNQNNTINGQTLATDSNGNFIKNENGEYQTVSGDYVSGNIKTQGADTRISTQLKKNLVTGAVMGTGSVATKVVGNAGKEAAKFFGKAAEAGAENPGLITGIMSSIAKILETIPKILSKIPFLPSSVKDGSELIVTAIYTHLDDAVKKAGEKLAGLATKIGNIMPWVQLAFVVGKGINAWGNAESILGITEEATTGQKIIAVLIAVINAAIPIVGDLIPNKVLVNIFMEIAPKLGIDVSELAAQRDRANEEVAKYNEENGTDLSIEEYNQMNGKAGIFTKAGNAMKSMVTNIKEQGFGKTVGNAIKSGAGKAMDVVKSGFDKVNELTGFTEILKMMKDGNVKGVLTYTSADEDDGTGMKIIKQIPTLAMKYSVIMPTMLISVGKKIAGVISNIINKVKGIFNIAKEEHDYANTLIKDPDSHLSDFFKFDQNEDAENPMSGFEKAFRVVSRLTVIPIAIIKKIGSGIANKFKETVNGVKSGFTALTQNQLTITKLALSGDVLGMWTSKAEDNPDNPLNGIMNVIGIGQKFSMTPLSLVSWAGHKIFEGIKNTVEGIKNSVTVLGSNQITIAKYAIAGDITGLWNHKSEDNPDNPLNGLMGVINLSQKISYTPITAISWVGHKIKDGFVSAVDKAKSNYKSMQSSVDILKGYAADGDIGSILKEKLNLEENDPMGGIWKTGFFISKLFYSATALITKIMGPIKELVGGVTEKLGDIKEGASNLKDAAVDKAKQAGSWVADKADAAFQGVKGWISGGDSGMPGTQNQFISQMDQRYRNMKLGNSTVGDKGCGPAVAAMVASSYGLNPNMDAAVKAAAQYQDKNGTKSAYFQDYLGRNGINVDPIDSKNISGGVMSALSQGQQVILLGQDKNNKSKKNSPFGPNNHYVIASGIDANGNIIIKDPEGNGPKAYNANILKNATVGFGTSGSGSNYDTDTAKKVWAYFRSKGYSPAATAGIMGNLYEESHMDPTRHQANGGPAAGIAQWEKYGNKNSRWGALDEYAKSMGYVWSDLDPQLNFIQKELTSKDSSQRFSGVTGSSALQNAGVKPSSYDAFKSSTDVGTATRLFEGVFERAGKPRMDARIKSASEYYKLYHDSSYNYTPDPSNGSIDDTSSTSGVSSSDSSSSSSTASVGNILSQIGSAFTTALGKAFGESSDDTSSSSSYSDSSTGSTGTITEDVVQGLTGPGNAKQKALAEKLLGIKGKLSYSMSGARNPEKGSADCSSTVNWAYKKVTGTDIGNNTGDILSNKNTEIIDMASNMDKTNGGSNSSGPNLSKLMPGDIMLYSRPTGSYNKGRPYRVGHVEMYIGNGERIGHGSGMGPKVTSASTDSKHYIMAKRLKGITDDASAAGSGLMIPEYGELATMSGGSSGILLNSRVGTKANGGSIRRLAVPQYYSGGDSNILNKAKQALNTVANNVRESGNKGAISADLVEKLLNSIIKVLETISSNTASVDKIYQVLAAYTKTSAATDATSTAAAAKLANDSSKSNDNNSEIDSNIANLVGTLAAIAKG